MWIGSGENSLYKFEDIEPCRRVAYPWLPARLSEQIQDKRVHIPPKKDEEFRVMSVDIALMASKKRDNDAASIFITSNIPVARANSSRRMTNVVYTENMEGMRSDDLALRVRRLFDAYDCDYLAVDTKGNGLPIVDLLMSDIVDKNTGVVYSALGCCNNDEINERGTDKNAPKVIWSILGSETFNSQCALGLREAFRNGAVRLLQSDYDCDATLVQLTGYNKLSPEQKQDFKMPYYHTTLLVNELVNLQAEQKGNGSVRVYEKTGMRKDRYSSLSYNIYVVREIERQMAKPKNDMSTLAQMISFRQPILI